MRGATSAPLLLLLLLLLTPLRQAYMFVDLLVFPTFVFFEKAIELGVPAEGKQQVQEMLQRAREQMSGDGAGESGRGCSAPARRGGQAFGRR